MSKVKIFNDPVHGFITIPRDIIFEIIEHPYFQRLRRIKQLGLTDLVYPGALHTRFHHALGAFHLMTEAIEVLRSKGINISDKEAKAATLAILMHDIGHGPFSHSLEHSIVEHSGHEDLSIFFIKQMASEMDVEMQEVLQIFQGQHPKSFLHELVASQLDVDRLDYLARDSFYTGVSEGIIGVERIIKMINVVDDKLVIEHKGIYSIEKFLIARRLMYWQVYLHKTVLAAENILLKILERARELALSGMNLFCTEPLRFFLYNRITKEDFINNSKVLDTFAQLDDHDIMAAIKTWVDHSDKILSLLSNSLINRKLFKIELANHNFAQDQINHLCEKVKEQYKVSAEEASYLVFSGTVTNAAYMPGKGENINILMKDHSVMDIVAASDQYDISSFSKTVQKYFLCYPRLNE